MASDLNQANSFAVSKSLKIQRVGVFLGARVSGIDLKQPLSNKTVDELKLAHANHGVLIFPDQTISSEDLKRFGRYFGDLSVHPFSTSSADAPELIVYDNKEGNPPAPTDIWHTDETFREAPPMGTALCSKIIPETGGNTAFASMSAVYEGLSDRWQRFLSGLEAVHDFKPFRSLFPSDPAGIAKLRHFEDRYPSTTHPVVHEYQYRHCWEPNMVVFWDNRNVQHSALHDYYPQRRLMERVTIAGTRPIAADPAANHSDLRRYLMPPLSQFRESGSAQKRQLDL